MFEIGSSLREARLRRKLELPDVERATHIRGRYLAALEEDRFDVLPGPAYARGFLRAYADYLGLEAQRFVDEYNSRFAQDEEQQAAPAVRVRRRRQWTDFRIAAIPVAVLLALIGWQVTRAGGRHATAPPPLTTTTGSTTTTFTRAIAPLPAVARLSLVAARGPAWIDVHRGTQAGRELYVGTLQAGQTVHFASRRLWIRMGAPWNLDARLDGKAVRLSSTLGNILVTARGVSRAP